jgi:hypothetical protein
MEDDIFIRLIVLINQIQGENVIATTDNSARPSRNMTPKQKTPPASASPTRKKIPDYKGGPPKLDKACSLIFMRTTCPGVGVVLAKKPNSTQDAFLGNMMEHLRGRKQQCKIVFIGHLRDPNGDNLICETANKSGNKYPTDVIVLGVDDDASISAAVSQLAVHMNSIASNECKDDWKYGVPFFINKGDATPSTPAPVSHYLLDYACASVIRRMYENCKTQQELLANTARAAIFTEIFGSDEVGVAAIESIDEGFYVNL